MRRTILAIAVLLGSVSATLLATALPPAGPDVLFTGRVLSDETGAPLPGVQVFVDGTTLGTVSDATGAYRLVAPRTALDAGSARLVAQLIGFERAEAPFRAVGDTVRTDFRLRPAHLSLESVVVTGQASDGRAAQRRVRAQDASAESAARSLAPSAAPVPTAPPPAGWNGADASFHAPYRRPDWNTEAYDHIEENAFLAASLNPLSTFSIDVDRASYSNVRRFLLDGELPPKDAVRIEEMVNYFPYAYPAPRGEHPVAVVTEVGPAPWRPEHRLLRIGLASPRVETRDLPASNLVFLVDVSGSMQGPDRLPLVKRSLRLLVNELRERDRVAIVVYAGAAGLVLPSTPGSDREAILDAIGRLEAGGSTAGGEGLRLAYEVARENHLDGGNNRVILATDGDFNVGVSSDAEMVRLVEERRGQGTFLTVLGFGAGNLKDSKMEQMADHGNGNYAYIDSMMEARKVLVSEMGGTLLTVAKDVKLQVEFNPARVRAYRLIGYENRLLAAEDFNDDAKDAGELGAGHTVTALYEVVPVGADTDVEVRGVDPLRYQQPPARASAAGGGELAFVRVRYKDPDGERSRLLEHPVPDRVADPSADFDFAAAVAGFGMLLRDSGHRGSLTPDGVLSLARRSRGDDADGYRAGFVRLVEAYRHLAEGGEGHTR